MVVRCAVDELPEPLGEVLRRFFVQDESSRTIGEALGTIASGTPWRLWLLRHVLEGDSQVSGAPEATRG